MTPTCTSKKKTFFTFWSVFWGSVWPCVRLGTPTNHQACFLYVFPIFLTFFLTFVHDLMMFSCSLAEVCPRFWRGSTQACLLNLFIYWLILVGSGRQRGGWTFSGLWSLFTLWSLYENQHRKWTALQSNDRKHLASLRPQHAPDLFFGSGLCLLHAP